MAHVNKVLRSINDGGGGRCVDVFARPDGTCGYQEYRRDVEDARGWFPIGDPASGVFADEKSALQAAQTALPWLRSVMAWRA